MDDVKKITTDLIEKILSKGVRDMPQNPAAQGYDERQIRGFYYIPEKEILMLASSIEDDVIKVCNNLAKINLESGEGKDSIIQKFTDTPTESAYGNTNTGVRSAVFGESNTNKAKRVLMAGKLNKSNSAQSLIVGIWNGNGKYEVKDADDNIVEVVELVELEGTNSIIGGTYNQNFKGADGEYSPDNVIMAGGYNRNIDSFDTIINGSHVKNKKSSYAVIDGTNIENNNSWHGVIFGSDMVNIDAAWSLLAGANHKNYAKKSVLLCDDNKNYAINSILAGWLLENHGEGSALFGVQNKNYGKYAFMYGWYTINHNDYGLVGGSYNEEVENALMVLGNGYDDEHRSNAFVVMKDGRVKGYGTPTANEDFVRVKELNEVKENIGGPVVIRDDLFPESISGVTYNTVRAKIIANSDFSTATPIFIGARLAQSFMSYKTFFGIVCGYTQDENYNDSISVLVGNTLYKYSSIYGSGIITDKIDLANLSGGSITVDSELSLDSTNPVQNRVITEALKSVGKKKAYVLYKNGTNDVSAPIESRDFGTLRYYDNVSDTIKSFTSNEERDVWLSGKTNNNIIFDTQAEELDLVYDSLGQPYTNKYYAFFEGGYYLLVNANDIYYVLELGNDVFVAENNIPDRWVISIDKTSQMCVLQVGEGAVDGELSETSLNPVQNKVITQALDEKIGDIETALSVILGV